MRKTQVMLRLLAFALFSLTFASLAQAQSRTFVSGVGDDLNPCSRTAPCKTYSKAHHGGTPVRAAMPAGGAAHAGGG